MRPKFTLKFCFETTSGQKKIIEKLSEYLADDDFSRIFVLNGYAGTGKTTLIAALVGALKDLNIKPVLLAPTGRAAKVLAQYAQEKALTIHKRIYRQRTNADYESKYSLNINTEKGAVFIVDEASMLSDTPGDGALFGSGSLLEDLVQYVRSGRACRLILVGDSASCRPWGPIAARRSTVGAGPLRRRGVRYDGRGRASGGRVGHSVQRHAGALHARKRHLRDSALRNGLSRHRGGRRRGVSRQTAGLLRQVRPRRNHRHHPLEQARQPL